MNLFYDENFKQVDSGWEAALEVEVINGKVSFVKAYIAVLDIWTNILDQMPWAMLDRFIEDYEEKLKSEKLDRQESEAVEDDYFNRKTEA